MAFVSRNPKSSFSNPPPSPFKYHVFLSFRGKDTRKNVTDHLYTALVNAGFHTFRDDPELERGENIKEKLESAIKQSQSSVVVFSKDYTSSRWCLDELVFILERRRTSDHVVLPVFFDVAPSQLRKKAKYIAEVQENPSAEKLDGWRAALKEVAEIAGMVLENEDDGHEAQFIQNVVKVIQQKLHRVPLSEIQEVLENTLRFSYRVHYQAERSLLNNPGMKEWLTELKEALYDAEDLLQEIKTEAQRQKIENGSSTSKVQELDSSLTSHAFELANIYPRVEEVLHRLQSITEQRKEVSSLEAGSGCRVSQTLQSTSMVEDSGVCGIDDQKEKLIKLLLSNDESGDKISVIPIVGMGGIGKTTLAQCLYNDDRVEDRFDIQAWVCVSENFDVLRISRDIYGPLTSKDCNSMSLNQVQIEMKKALKGKSFLLVLDDVWTKNYTDWDILWLPFQFGATGSKIIVTTRDEKVADMVGNNLEAHHAMPLSEEDGWSLFEKHAFKKTYGGGQSDLKEIGKQIVRKCNGLPLAIKSLGGLLRSRSSKEEWETILESEIWELPERENGILPSLWLSYIDLPPHLRRCFVYCALFPNNHIFKTLELIYMWKAEDLLQPQQNRTAVEVGQAYFNELISRSFFQRLSIDDDKLSIDKRFTMHDLINDLARFVSGDFFLKWNRNTSPDTLSKTRYMNYDVADPLEKLKAIRQSKYLRVVLPSTSLYQFSLSNLQWLRMLNLSEYNITELPDSITHLIHLVHLDLSETPIIKLPETICTLYNLQTLLLARCYELEELPANLGRLINLNQLDLTHTNRLKRMPPGMDNLKQLQILSKFVLNDLTAESNLPELKKLENLRGELWISGLQYTRGLKDYILRNKKFLKELVLEWDWRCDSEGPERLQPHPKLERLTIIRYGGKTLPDWSGYYCSAALVYLQLSSCSKCTSLPPLGQLPSLIELHIIGLDSVVSIGSEFYYGYPNSTRVNKPFRCLRVLKFSEMESWTDWWHVEDEGSERVLFPALLELVISNCGNLTGGLAVDRFPKLKSLDLVGTGRLNLNKVLRTLTSLERLKLHIDGAEKVEDLLVEEVGPFPCSVVHLEIHGLNSESIDGAKWFGHLNLLQKLVFKNCPNLPKSGLPASLQNLEILDCYAIQCLPETRLLVSLQNLTIQGCPKLRCLPGRPPSLRKLMIVNCPLLEERCERKTGEDWLKIAHIPKLRELILESSNLLF